MNKLKHFALTGICAALLVQGQMAYASAFQIWEQDNSDLGNAHAGNAASADTAGTEYTNPAGMVRLQHPEVSVGGAIITPDIQFNGNVGPTGATAPVNDAQGGTSNFVPNLHIVAPITDRLAAGFGVTVPFGLATNWGEQDNASWAATKTLIQTINIGPSLAFAITDKLSIGAGFDASNLQGEFDQVSTDPNIPTPAGFSITNKANAWGYGYNLGALYQFNDATRVGLTYRSAISYNATGTSTAYAPEFGPPVYSNNSVSTNVTLPATWNLSAYHDLNSAWTLLASINYTQWNCLKNLVLNGVSQPSSGPNTTQIQLPLNFHNTWEAVVGANYHITQANMLRFGGGFDESPGNTADRTLRLPDSNRIMVALGWHYQPIANLGIDLGYEHIFAQAATINNTVPLGDIPPVIEQGTINASGDLIGAQISYKFA